MKKKANIFRQLRTWISHLNAVACISLLLFLTVSNYYVYSFSASNSCITEINEEAFPQTEDANCANPAGPDEKAPNGGPSITEEYCHESLSSINEFDVTIDHKHNWFYLLKKNKQLSYPTITPPPDLG